MSKFYLQLKILNHSIKIKKDFVISLFIEWKHILLSTNLKPNKNITEDLKVQIKLMNQQSEDF